MVGIIRSKVFFFLVFVLHTGLHHFSFISTRLTIRVKPRCSDIVETYFAECFSSCHLSIEFRKEKCSFFSLKTWSQSCRRRLQHFFSKYVLSKSVDKILRVDSADMPEAVSSPCEAVSHHAFSGEGFARSY